jgi:isochorismate pyruvate lyase
MWPGMSSSIIDPENCSTMTEVRAGVDAVDTALVALLVRRFGYMRAAARIKPERDQVRDEARKDQVIANVRALADAGNIPSDIIANLWDELVEASIAYEAEEWDALRR